MVREGQRLDSEGTGLANQVLGRTVTVGTFGVGMKIN